MFFLKKYKDLKISSHVALSEFKVVLNEFKVALNESIQPTSCFALLRVSLRMVCSSVACVRGRVGECGIFLGNKRGSALQGKRKIVPLQPERPISSVSLPIEL